MEADQTPEGGVAHVVPDIITGNTGADWLLQQGSHSAAAWADVAVINPWTMYLTYGDKEILRLQYQSMKGWIDFMKDHSVDYIWNYKLQFATGLRWMQKKEAILAQRPMILPVLLILHILHSFCKKCRDPG